MSPVVVAAAVATAAGVWAVVDVVARTSRLRVRRAPDREGHQKQPAESPLVRMLIGTGRRAGLAVAVRGADAQLSAAGRPFALGPREYGALCAGLAVACFAMTGVWATVLPGRLGVVALIGAPVVGAALPGLILRRMVRRRGCIMRREVADVLDLLRVLVASGLSIDLALATVGTQRRGLIAAELARTAQALALGERRADAYASLAARCPIDTMAQVVAALQRSARHGVGVDDVLRALAAQARAQHVQAVRDGGARAAPKIQLVVALVLVPAVMLLVAAALVNGVA